MTKAAARAYAAVGKALVRRPLNFGRILPENKRAALACGKPDRQKLLHLVAVSCIR